MAERDRSRLAAMLAANAHLQRLARFPALGDGELDQLSDPFLVQHLEGIVREDAALHVRREKAARVVATEAERRLREVVGAEREELRGPRDASGGECSARQL